MKKVFEIVVARSVRQDLDYIPKNHHSSIQEAIRSQLTYEPDSETTNRKPLQRTIENATWELRCGIQNSYRVLYDIAYNDIEDLTIIEILGIVEVIAIGEKRQEKLFIQGREVNL
ncbi:MAG: type II toxin-antitoxin system RelE family toxin [Casimicrobium sp.]